MPTSVITGSGVFHPEHVITNEELVSSFNRYVDSFNEKHRVDIDLMKIEPKQYSSDEFIVKASGIERRYVFDKEGILDINRMRPRFESREPGALSMQAEMAVKTIERACTDANIQSSDIDCILFACSSMQRAYPAMACEVQGALGAKGFAFDMNVACSSGTFACAMADSLIRQGLATRVAVVCPEVSSAHIDFTDRDSHFIFGDAASAVIIESSEYGKNGFEILSTHLMTDYSNNIYNTFGFMNHCEMEERGPDTGAFFQNGRKVFKEVVPKAFEHIVSHCEKAQVNAQDIRRYWFHQANSHMNLLLAKKLLNREPSEDITPMILNEYANTGSAGSLIAFDHHHKDLKNGDLGILCSFGAGYSVGSLLIQKRG